MEKSKFNLCWDFKSRVRLFNCIKHSHTHIYTQQKCVWLRCNDIGTESTFNGCLVVDNDVLCAMYGAMYGGDLENR